MSLSSIFKPENMTWRFSLYGLAFGLLFPVIATLIQMYTHGLTTLSEIASIHIHDPLFWAIDFSPIILAIMAGMIGNTRSRIIDLLEDVQIQGRAYERFYPKEFITLLGKNDVRQVNSGVHSYQEMTILFSDIRGFTSMSESMSSGELFEMLRDYFEWVSPIFKNHKGFIDKYIGDAIMAIFPQTPENAVRAAGDVMHHLQSYNEMTDELNRPAIDIGIGIHTGELSLGTIGGGSRLSTTVMGDVVNLASRLEGLTRRFHVNVIITDKVQMAMSEEMRDNTREIAIVRVKGRTNRITIYEYFGGESPLIRDAIKKTRGDYLRALYMHRGGENMEALKLFEKIHIENPMDPLPVFYIEKCKQNASRVEQSRKKNKIILLIDDNKAIIDLVRLFLKDQQYDLYYANSGKSAIKQFELLKPNVVLLDYNLPDSNGLELLPTLIAKGNANTRFLALTADENAGAEFLRQGAIATIPKPIRKTRLLATLESIYAKT